jgi:hypothetical protein
MDPKKHLRELLWKTYHKEYLNTIHNAVIAKQVNLASLRRSASFAPHFQFARNVKAALRN